MNSINIGSRKFIGFIGSSLILSFLVLVLFAGSSQAQLRPLGTDVSGYQPQNINWTAVKGDGVSFAWVKATEGTYYVNPNFTSQLTGAASANTAVIGAQQVFRTTDGGRVFKRVALPIADSGWDVTFLDATHGLALGKFGESAYPPARLYYTSNGGASYRLIPIG